MNFGFIGAGNMAGAIIGGIIAAKLAKKEEITAYDISEKTLAGATEKYGILSAQSNSEVARNADIIVLAVKPQFCETVIREIAVEVTAEKMVVSIAAGQKLADLEHFFAKPLKLVRVMPNTPALVGEGMSAICPNGNINETDLKTICDIFRSFGNAEVVPEHLIDAVIGVSGSSPAYVFLFIEALADGAVAGGMPREMAYRFAAQAVLGSAKMVLESGLHPGALKDMVCSPGGTTIEAVRVLEKEGLRAAVIEAVHACIERSRGL